MNLARVSYIIASALRTHMYARTYARASTGAARLVRPCHPARKPGEPGCLALTTASGTSPFFAVLRGIRRPDRCRPRAAR